ncbi:diguanylate cyclase [Enterobacteriaceae bacterium 4M9]|nr:diguanylate cyclase [Enterobacteriaceae bacterium 4M9]
MNKTFGLSKKIYFSLVSAFMAIIVTAYFVIDSQKKTIHKSYSDIASNFIDSVAILYIDHFINLLESKITLTSREFGQNHVFNRYFYDEGKTTLSHMMTVISNSPELNAIILADTQGDYIRVPEKASYKKKMPEEIIKRPWFIEEPNSPHRIKFTEPYQDSVTGVSTVTVSAPIINTKGRFNGVLAFDINLSQMNKSMERLLPPIAGNIVLLSDDGQVIADDMTDAEPETDGYRDIMPALKKSNGVWYDDERKLWFFSHRFDGPRWMLVYSVDARLLTALTWNESQKVIYGFAISLLILLFFGFYLKSNWDKALIKIIGHIKTGAPNGWGNLENMLSEEINNTRKRQDALRVESMHDPLTGASNRRAFDMALADKLSTHKHFSLALMDIDNFKRINDTFGHVVGDEVLKGLVSECRSIFDLAGCEIYRYGGEEFAIIFNNMPPEHAWTLLEKCRLSIRNRIWREDIKRVTFSAGLGSRVEDEESERLVERIDKLLYRAKQTGKDKIVVSDSV